MQWKRWVIIVVWVVIGGTVACHQINPSGKKKKTVPHIERKSKEPETRSQDTSKPVTVFRENMQDQVTDNDFIVKVFHTMKDDKFKIDIQYGGNTASDDFDMIPSKYYKRIALRKGNSNNECILGFIDHEGKFNQMKLITGSGTSIGIKTLKVYYLSEK